MTQQEQETSSTGPGGSIFLRERQQVTGIEQYLRAVVDYQEGDLTGAVEVLGRHGRRYLEQARAMLCLSRQGEVRNMTDEEFAADYNRRALVTEAINEEITRLQVQAIGVGEVALTAVI